MLRPSGGENSGPAQISTKRPFQYHESEGRDVSQPLIVMKFGGTSIGSPERIIRAADLIQQARERFTVVAVVSAMAKVTDMLLETMRLAEADDLALVETHLGALKKRHVDACRELLPAGHQDEAIHEIERLLRAFERIARGMLMLGERPPKSVDEAVPTGEKLSAYLLSAVLRSRGTPARAVDACELIVTDGVFGSASPLIDLTRACVNARLRPAVEAGEIPIVTGFSGATPEGQPTTLGRGGSDFSASILASALDASELWIWTDVDGILTADPRLVKDAKVLPEVSYSEAAELAFNGAKVLHPRTLTPLVKKQIPVRIKNSFEPEKKGTRIVSEITADHGVRAITSLAKVALITIEAASASMSGAQLMARALEAAARANVEVLLMTRSSFRQNFCMLVHTDELSDALDSLREELKIELAHDYVHPIKVDDGVGLLAAVGEGMHGTPGLAGKVFTAISRQQINIIAIAQGSSELTIAIVVAEQALDDAVRAVHEACGLGAG